MKKEFRLVPVLKEQAFAAAMVGVHKRKMWKAQTNSASSPDGISLELEREAEYHWEEMKFYCKKEADCRLFIQLHLLFSNLK